MKLNVEQIKSLTYGAVEIPEEDGWIRFHRFTPAQREVYDRLHPQFEEKVRASSNIRLTMETDSQHLRFDYKLQTGSSRPYGYFDVYEDGVLKHHFGDLVPSVTEGRGELVLGPGMKRVEMHFPFSCVTAIANVELDDGAQVKPVRKSRSMIAFGDSITQGYTAIYPSLSYISRLTDMLDADCVNKGIGGERFFPELAECPDERDPELITVAYGTNDWNNSPREVVADKCRRFYEALSRNYPKAKIFAITPLWRKDGQKETPFGAPQPAVSELIADICKDIPNVTVIHGSGFVPWLEPFYEDERLHPNDMGFDFYARNLYNAMIPYL